MAAALVALNDQDYVSETVRLNSEGMAFLTQACSGVGIAYIESVGNFLTIDVGVEASPVYEALLDEGR